MVNGVEDEWLITRLQIGHLVGSIPTGASMNEKSEELASSIRIDLAYRFAKGQPKGSEADAEIYIRACLQRELRHIFEEAQAAVEQLTIAPRKCRGAQKYAADIQLPAEVARILGVDEILEV